MRHLILAFFLSSLSLCCEAQNETNHPATLPSPDSIQHVYAIMQVNWTSKRIVIYYENGKSEIFKPSFDEWVDSYPEAKRNQILLSKLAYLRRKNYALVDSYEDNGFTNFIFIKN